VIHFALIVTGWNCANLVSRCWRSIAGQGGLFTWEAHVYDDGSDDSTWTMIERLPPDDRRHAYRASENLGAAHARHRLLERVHGDDTICVLVDLDDWLEVGALARVAREYETHRRTWLTYGSWEADRPNGRHQANAQRPYPPEVVAARTYRGHPFRAAPLRTFRRHLLEGVEPRHLQGADGSWLRACTDVALMWALLEQCAPERVRYIPDTLYRYAWRRQLGTIMRYGSQYKREIRAYLETIPPLPLKVA